MCAFIVTTRFSCTCRVTGVHGLQHVILLLLYDAKHTRVCARVRVRVRVRMCVCVCADLSTVSLSPLTWVLISTCRVCMYGGYVRVCACTCVCV